MIWFIFFIFKRAEASLFFSAQAFTKWPPVFSGETRRISVADGMCAGLGPMFG